jgi:hypothetical protein
VTLPRQVVEFPSYQEALADSAPPQTSAEAWLSRAAILDAGDTPAAVRAIRRRGSLTAGTGFQPTYQAPRSPAHLLDGQMLSWLASNPPDASGLRRWTRRQ